MRLARAGERNKNERKVAGAAGRGLRLCEVLGTECTKVTVERLVRYHHNLIVGGPSNFESLNAILVSIALYDGLSYATASRYLGGFGCKNKTR